MCNIVCVNCRQCYRALCLRVGKTAMTLRRVKPNSQSSRRQITPVQVSNVLPAPPCTPVLRSHEYIQVEPVLYNLAREELRSETISALWISFYLCTFSLWHILILYSPKQLIVSYILARCNLAK